MNKVLFRLLLFIAAVRGLLPRRLRRQPGQQSADEAQAEQPGRPVPGTEPAAQAAADQATGERNEREPRQPPTWVVALLPLLTIALFAGAGWAVASEAAEGRLEGSAGMAGALAQVIPVVLIALIFESAVFKVAPREPVKRAAGVSGIVVSATVGEMAALIMLWSECYPAWSTFLSCATLLVLFIWLATTPFLQELDELEAEEETEAEKNDAA